MTKWCNLLIVVSLLGLIISIPILVIGNQYASGQPIEDDPLAALTLPGDPLAQSSLPDGGPDLPSDCNYHQGTPNEEELEAVCRAQQAQQGETCDPSVLPPSNVPVDPGNGGRSIGLSALQPGDIILSTTDQVPSKLIRFATDSPVSHSILYVGNGLVIEAVENGVRLVQLETALSDASFAVAIRYPGGLTHDQALRIADFAGKQLGTKYDFPYGSFGQAMFRLSMKIADLADTECSVRDQVATINLGTRSNDKWFCSELILAAFAAAGVPLTFSPASWTAPGDVIPLISNGNLDYVGHIITHGQPSPPLNGLPGTLKE